MTARTARANGTERRGRFYFNVKDPCSAHDAGRRAGRSRATLTHGGEVQIRRWTNRRLRGKVGRARARQGRWESTVVFTWTRPFLRDVHTRAAPCLSSASSPTSSCVATSRNDVGTTEILIFGNLSGKSLNACLCIWWSYILYCRG